MLRASWLVVGIFQVAGALGGCSNCDDEVAAANSFLEDPTNLVCQSDEDCAVVPTGCAEPWRSSCGQAVLNRDAAASGKWQQISDGLADCAGSCAQCLAALLPQCSEGFCGGPP